MGKHELDLHQDLARAELVDTLATMWTDATASLGTLEYQKQREQIWAYTGEMAVPLGLDPRQLFTDAWERYGDTKREKRIEQFVERLTLESFNV